jgi:hypothetical protein
MATRLPVASVFASAFRSYGEGHEVMPQAGALALLRLLRLLRWLLFIRALLMLSTKK